MQPDVIVVLAPVLNDGRCLLPIAEPFHRQTFVAKLAVETFCRAVLPWFARINQGPVEILTRRPLEQRP